MSSEEFDEHRNINDHACMHASASNSYRKYNNILMIPGNEQCNMTVYNTCINKECSPLT